MRFLGTVLGLALLGQPLGAEGFAADSVRAPAKPILRAWEAGLVVGLTAGTAALDQRVRNAAQAHRSRFKDHIADFGNLFGDKKVVFPALVVSTLAGKAFGSETMERVSWHALESTAIAGGVALILKSVIGRLRPDASPNDPFNFHLFRMKDNAFPSGHTAISFSLATSLAGETNDRWSDVAFYSVAALTGLSRINDDRHWLSDTVTGASLGVMSGRLVQRWHRPYVQTASVRVAFRIQF